MSTRARWLSAPSPSPGAASRLFCFPYAGAGAPAYFPWGAALAPRDIEVQAVQLPGRGSRFAEPLRVDLRRLAADLATAMEPLLDRPWSLFGHSMGAILAWETMRELQARRAPAPRCLLVSGAHPPHVPRTGDRVGDLPDEAFLEVVARRYGGIPAEVLANRELLDLVLPALRADMQMLERYVADETVAVPIPLAAFAGRADRRLEEEHMKEWQRLTSSAFSLTWLDGDHFFLNAPAARAELLDHVVRHVHPAGAPAASRSC